MGHPGFLRGLRQLIIWLHIYQPMRKMKGFGSRGRGLGACVSSSPRIWHRYGARGDFASIWKVETILDSSLVASAAPAERLTKLHTSLR